MLGTLGVVVVSLAGEGPPAKDAPAVYEVWKPVHWVFQHPATYSRRVARLSSGATVEILPAAEKRGWSRVKATVQEDGETVTQTGWMILYPKKRTAGDMAEHLGGAAAQSTLALVVKGITDELEKLATAYARQHPEAVARYQALESTWLEPDDLDAFVREGGLRVRESEGR